MESPLQVILAGFNVDADLLKEIKDYLPSDLISQQTPETICAAFARISRDPRDVTELRHHARKEVEKARATFRNTVFEMGHNSIAEHAVFNIDLIGLSRRAVEEVERKRLQSYTEKSQRYITLQGDFVIPPEIQRTPLESEFVELTRKQNNFYNNNLSTLIAWHINQNPNADLTNAQEKNRIEGYGKEDARYALAMATQAQLGMTLSARNLERLVTELRSSESGEIRDIGEKLLEQVNGIAPSVVKYTAPKDYYTKTRKELRKHVSELIKRTNGRFENRLKGENIFCSRNINLFTNLKRDDSILSGLIFSSSNLPFFQCFNLAYCIPQEEKMDLLKKADSYQEKHDPKLREYELGDRVAEISLSSSAFAQLKRHRMNTLIPQAYDIGFSPTIPQAIEQTSLNEDLIEIVNRSSQFYKKVINQGHPTIVAEYALTNAHKRRVLLDANNRQIYAICAERENPAAQWDIRSLTKELHGLIQRESPITAAYLCGKETFDVVKAERDKV